MTATKRIFWNVLATYGRSLYALVVGLLTARWILMALGAVDFGLYGVVGGLTFFVVFVNELLAMSVARFLGVSVGAARKSGDVEDGVEDCRRWFNTALLIHTVVPVVLVLVGYPVGEMAVRCFLTIPTDRVEVCVWVWRFTCLSCFVGMLNVPFRAMYTAKQEIAELTIYSFCTTTVTAVLIYYMASRPREWLFWYALSTCIISIVPNFIIAWRAVVMYPECRIVPRYMWSRNRIKEILNFAMARFFTSFSSILVSQGQQILVNKYFGPRLNAAMRVGASVASHSATLSGSLNGAFWPAITNAVGECDDEKVRRMSFQVCRLSTFLVMIFAIPLMIECNEVLVLWLKDPPRHSAAICCATLIAMLIGRLTEGYWMAVLGFGKRIPYYSWWVSWPGFIGFGVTWALFSLGADINGVCVAIVLESLITLGFRLWLGRNLAGLSLRYWTRSVCLPLMILAVLTLPLGILSLYVMEPSFKRVVITTVFIESVLIPCAWRYVLSQQERQFVKVKLLAKIPMLRNRFHD